MRAVLFLANLFLAASTDPCVSSETDQLLSESDQISLSVCVSTVSGAVDLLRVDVEQIAIQNDEVRALPDLKRAEEALLANRLGTALGRRRARPR